MTQIGVLLFIGAFFSLMAKVYNQKQPSWIGSLLRGLGPFRGAGMVLILLILWAAFSLILLTFPNFSWAVSPKILSIPLHQSYWALMFLLLGMVLAFRLLPEAEPQADLSPWVARLWLGAILGLGVYLRLYPSLDMPIGTYWEDNDIELPRYQADMHDYRGAFIFFGHGEPLANYLQIFLFRLLPGVSSVAVEKLGGTLMDMTTVWILYLLGKEVAGRRVGILAAAIGAVSKPEILKVIWAVRLASLSLGPALALLFFFRLMKKPDLKHFFQWGLALAIGVYTYSPYRPMVPFFIFLVLGWVLLEDIKQGFQWPEWSLVGVTALTLLVYFFYANVVFRADSWIERTDALTKFALPCVVLAVVLLLTLKIFPKMILEGKYPKLTGWLVGAWFCVIISFPIMGNGAIMDRMRDYEHLSDASVMLSRLLGRSEERLQTMFFRGGDREDMAIPDDAFFGYSEVTLIALGFAFLFARPNFRKVVIFITALVGLAPHIVSAGTHSGRALACTAPFYVLGALAVNQVLTSVYRLWKGRFLFVISVVGLAVFWVWSAQGILDRVYHQFCEKFPRTHYQIRLDALKAQSEGDRVYLDNGLEAVASTLYDGHPVYYLWNSSNVVFLNPAEKQPRGIVMFLHPSHMELKNKITAAFPTSRWSEVYLPNKPNELQAFRCFVPFADVLDFSQKNAGPPPESQPTPNTPPPPTAFFEVRQVPPPCWERRFFPTRMGMTFGFLHYEDRVADANAPPRPEVGLDQVGITYQGDIHVKEGGDYQLIWDLDGFTRVRVDGHSVLDVVFGRTERFMDPPASGVKNISLKAGDHRVEVMTCLQRSRTAPHLVLQREGSLGAGKSLWSSFEF